MYWIILSILFSLCGTWSAFAVTTPGGQDILNGLFESRQSLQRGYIEVETVYKDSNTSPVHKKWNIWFDGKDKRRADIDTNNYTTVICLDCYAKRTEIYYTTQPPPDLKGKMALSFYDGDEESSLMRNVPNPRWFGCLSLTIESAQLYQSPSAIYETELAKYAEVPKVVSEKRSNVDCWRVDYKPPGDSSYSVWVDQKAMDRIVRIESRFEADGVLYIDGVDSESEQYQNKIWFPKKLTYNRTENGKITMSEETLIKVLSLNTSLPSDIFSLHGINFLKPDTPVMWALNRDRPVSEGELVWDGNNIVARGTFEMDKIMRESERFKPLSMFLILSGIALILFGIGMKLWKRYGT